MALQLKAMMCVRLMAHVQSDMGVFVSKHFLFDITFSVLWKQSRKSELKEIFFKVYRD